MKNLKKNFIKYFAEFLIVAFGVFLGMYVNEWQNDKKQAKNVEKVIQNIISELSDNKKRLVESINYLETLKVNLDSTVQVLPQEKYRESFIDFLKNNKMPFRNFVKGWKGTGFNEFDSTAFEVAKMSGILQDMDIDLVLEISEVYKKASRLEDFQKLIETRMGSLNFDTKLNDVVMDFQLITGDNLENEKSLLKKVDETIEIIENRKK